MKKVKGLCVRLPDRDGMPKGRSVFGAITAPGQMLLVFRRREGRKVVKTPLRLSTEAAAAVHLIALQLEEEARHGGV